VGVRLGGPEGQFGLWVHPVRRSPAAGVAVDTEEAYPVRMFVRGASWTWFFGLVRSDRHLFGVDGPVALPRARHRRAGTRHLLASHPRRLDLDVHRPDLIGIGIGIGVPIGAMSGSSAAPPT
jgi:peptide/nickel transport system permease protein